MMRADAGLFGRANGELELLIPLICAKGQAKGAEGRIEPMNISNKHFIDTRFSYGVNFEYPNIDT